MMNNAHTQKQLHNMLECKIGGEGLFLMLDKQIAKFRMLLNLRVSLNFKHNADIVDSEIADLPCLSELVNVRQ